LQEVVRYFDMHVVMEKRLDPSRQYLFAQYPHGILPIASFLSAYYVADVVPNQKIFCCIHSGIFHLPIVRCAPSPVEHKTPPDGLWDPDLAMA
jgi:hypothetical protein